MLAINVTFPDLQSCVLSTKNYLGEDLHIAQVNFRIRIRLTSPLEPQQIARHTEPCRRKNAQLTIAWTSLLPHMPIGKVWIYRLLFLFVCVFVRLMIFPPKIILAASNFALWFIGVLGRESLILGNFAPPEAKKSRSQSPEAQNRTNWPATGK